MKLRKWLSVSLAVALMLSAVHGQYRIVSAEETEEETVTAEDEKTLENASSEPGGGY